MSDSDKSVKQDGKEKKDSTQSDVAFLYRTMSGYSTATVCCKQSANLYQTILHLTFLVERDPSKRKVKPVENHLMQIHFGMSDDDEDSDYEFKPEAASDDGGGSEMDDFDDDVDEEDGDNSQKESKDIDTENEAETDDDDGNVTQNTLSLSLESIYH